MRAGRALKLSSWFPGRWPTRNVAASPPLLLRGVTGHARDGDEIFGPLLPLVPYGDLAQAIDYVNARPRPLALYYFDTDTRLPRGTQPDGVRRRNDQRHALAHRSRTICPLAASGRAEWAAITGQVASGRFRRRREFSGSRDFPGIGLFKAPPALASSGDPVCCGDFMPHQGQPGV